MAGYGDIITSAVNFETGRREGDKKSRALGRYRLAESQIGQDQANDDYALQFNHGLMADEGYRDQNELARALGSPDRLAVGEGSRQGTYGRLDAALQPVAGQLAPNYRGDVGGMDMRNAQATWAGNVGAQYAPRLESQRALIGEEGAQRGMTTYDNAAYNRLGDEQVDIGRRSGELGQRYSLMSQYRDQLLANEGRRFKYQGPSSSYYNARLVGQLAGMGVDAASAYSGGRQNGSGAAGAPNAAGGYGTQQYGP